MRRQWTTSSPADRRSMTTARCWISRGGSSRCPTGHTWPAATPRFGTTKAPFLESWSWWSRSPPCWCLSAGYGLVPQLDPAPSRSAPVSPLSPADHHQHGGDLDHHDQDSKNGAFVVPNRGVAAGQVCPVGQRLLPPLEIQHLAVVMERRSAGEDVVHCLRISRS